MAVIAQWTDVGTFAVLAAQLVLLTIAARFAWIQIRDARRLREDEARPFVVPDFEVRERDQAIHIVIANLGRTVAQDVRLNFNPQLASTLDSDANVVSPRDLDVFQKGIPTLPPGKRLAIMYDIFHARDAAKLPDAYRVSVSFYAPALEKAFSDEFELDLGIYRNVLFEMRRDIHDVHERVKEIAAELRKRNR
jgi:hypothetical protein